MRFLVIERFKGGNPTPVYQRAKERGRMLPSTVTFIDSWVDADLSRCFQLMECEHASALAPWIEQWRDLVDFEVVETLSTQDVMNRLTDELDT